MHLSRGVLRLWPSGPVLALLHAPFLRAYRLRPSGPVLALLHAPFLRAYRLLPRTVLVLAYSHSTPFSTEIPEGNNYLDLESKNCAGAPESFVLCPEDFSWTMWTQWSKWSVKPTEL